MSVVQHAGSLPPCPSPYNLTDALLWSNGAEDDKIALSVLSASGAERWSYGRLRDTVARTSGALVAAGLAPGNRLLLSLGSTPAFPVVFLAATAVGILPVPAAESLTAREKAALVRAVSPDAVISRGPAPEGFSSLTRLEVDDILGNGEPTRPIPGDPDRPAFVMVTSGTGGMPKPVVHAHRAIWGRRPMREGWTDLRPEDRMLHAGAFNWTYTLGTGLFDPWSVGATALVLAPGTDPAMLPLLAKRHDATMIAAVPGVYRRLLKAPLPPLPRLRHALSAGEKLPETIRNSWASATGTAIHEAYGQTECSTFISGSPTRPAPEGTLGYPQPGRRIVLLDCDGTLSAPGETGEIAVSTDDPGLALEVDGARPTGAWFRTGDLGSFTPEGAVVYHGRADDVLTAGGYRISPLEIEAAFEAHPDIEAAAAVDHHLSPDTVVVALHYAAAAPIDEAILARLAGEALAPQKRPRLFLHHAELPRGRNGKLLRRALGPATDAGS